MSSDIVNRYNISEVATFGGAAPDANSTWVHRPFIGSPRIKKDQLVDDANETDNDGARSDDCATVKGASFSGELRVYTGTKAFDGTGGDSDPSACFAQKELESYFGAAAASFVGTTVAAASGAGNAAPLKVASATGLTVGMALQVGSEVRFVTAISGTDVTLDADLDTAANYDEGAVVYGAFNFEPTLGSYAKVLYLNHEMSGHGDMAGPGQVTSFSISGLAAKSGLRYNFGYAFDSFTSSVTPASFAANTFTGTPIVANGSGVVSVNGTARAVGDASVNFGVKKEEIVTSSTSGATNGRSGWENTEFGDPVIECTSYYQSADWTNFTSRGVVPVRLVFSTGSSNAAKARGTIAVFMPRCQVTVEDAVINGQVAQKVRFMGRRPTSTQKTAGLDKPVWFAVFGGV